MKKVLAILLSLILIISIVPMGLFSITASAATGGKTGDCMWVKDGTVLTISGNGDMNDYTSSILPWGTSITEVIIEEGVTSIGDYAFNRCKSLTSITIPNSVTSIGMYAFEQCTTLKSITIPDSVTSIGYGAFSNCASLKSVNITDIAAWCKIKFGDNPLGSASAGELYLNGTLVTDLTIPDSVTSIGGSAFSNCTSLTSVTIPDSVTSIGGSAFYDCKSLTRVDFGDSVKSIGNYAFYNCTKLTSVNLPDSVKSIGEWAFYNCYKLTIITIPDSVTSIGKFAFYSCSNLESITLPFVGSSRNASGTADAVFGYIFGYTTSSSTGTTRQYYSSSSSYYYYIPSSIKSVTITDDPTIPYGAFYNCESLTNVNLPDSVTSIGEEAFYNCTGLTSITIPDSVKSIGGWAFDGCTSLKSVNITDIAAWCKIDFYFSTSNPLYYADELYLNGTLVTDLTIPDSVTSISEYAFFGYTKLTSITIPNSVTSIGGSAFFCCTKLTSITIPDSVTSIGSSAFNATGYYNNNDNWENDVLYIGDYLIDVKTGFSGSYTIKSTTRHIADYAFAYSGLLINIIIPDGVTSIGRFAFKDCELLTSITIPYSVTSIGSSAFNNCASLTDVYYGGENRNKIFIDSSNTELINATWHYKSCIGKAEHSYDNACDDTCNDCGAIRTVDHNFEWIIDTPNTCGTNGIKHEECTICHAKRNEYTIIPATGNHTYDNDCDVDCNICGATREAPHNFVWVIELPSTCGVNGTKHEECTVCHAKRNENTTIPATGNHTYDHGCDKDCNVCGETRTTSHKYSNNCDASCNVCGATRTAPHSYKSAVTKATTSKNGKIVKTCSGCKKKVTSTIYYAKSFSLSKTSFTYNGKVQTPTVTVKDAKGKVIDPKYYTLSYSSGRKNVGTYKIKVTLKGNYSGSKTLSYKINPISISKCKVSISGTSYTYNGKTIKPSVKVLSAGGSTLKNGTHYTVSYSSGCKNPGTYKVTVKMKGSYSGSKTFTYKINPISISKCKVSISGTSYYYDGKTKTPSVKVQTASGSTLKNGTHYTVSYSSGRKNVGTYKVTVKMKGTYSGSKTFTFKIIPPKTSISKITADINTMKVYITKKSTQVTGYEIQYASTSDFTDALTKTITSYNTTSATLAELTAETTYYVRVRTYKTVSGVKYYSGWSTVKVITTKPAPIVEQ